ncbi:MAG TPA: pyridine nucleotide-disulfide oxidoreductase [Lentisphaeria bacterium]|nr:pyridine nucleotide-disulfide oxidoreductase [Lentisphaeria bacterium]
MKTINPKDLVLVEAESFNDIGGWVVDQQSMDVMGSPYLLAHGLGKPVANARTQVKFRNTGKYRLWIRTRDWVPPYGPGKFHLHVNGQPLDKIFGLDGDGSWQWHDGGTVEIKDTSVNLELVDLTGFEGRCDAILFAKFADSDFIPPNSGAELMDFRRCLLGLPPTPPDEGSFDLVVAGGGYAGLCAAVSAARMGLNVALVHDRPVLGGNASGEVRVGPIGGIDGGLYPRNADIIKELHKTPRGMGGSGGIRSCPDDDFVEAIVKAEKNISLFLEMHVYQTEMKNSEIIALRARHICSSGELRFAAPLFADCTGDASVGFLAGAEWRMGCEGRDQTGEALAPKKGDGMLMGVSNFWLANHTEHTASFPRCPWALEITEESVDVSTPKYPPKFGQYAYAAGWNWESGFNDDQIKDAEHVRDHNFRAMYGTWDFLKNWSKDRKLYEKAELSWSGFIMGKRDTRRLLGDIILSQQDITRPEIYPDACVTATWYFDLHFPHPDNTRFFPGEEFRSLAYDDPNFEKFRGDIEGSYTQIDPYPIPYRCFYSKNISNLFMAGRNISVTHVALAPVRVMNTTAMMGTVVGRAAYACRKLNASPRELYEKHLEDLKQILSDPEGYV